MNKCSDVNKFLARCSMDTAKSYWDLIKDDTNSFVRFNDYLEDIILFELISGKYRDGIVLSTVKGVTSNIKYALVASSLSKNGKVNANLLLSDSLAYNKNNIIYAKESAIKNDKKRLSKPFNEYVDEVCDYVYKKNSLSNPYRIIECGIACAERNSGYVEVKHDERHALKHSINKLNNTYDKERNNMILYGLKDSLSYDILNYVFNEGSNRHYPLATSVALKNMALLTYMVDNDIELFDGYETVLQDTLRNIKAAKIVDMDTMKLFEEKFLRTMNGYLKENNNNNNFFKKLFKRKSM